MVAVLLIAVFLALLPALPARAATPTVSGAGTFAYTEQEPAIPIGAGLTVAGGGFYDGGSIEFAPGDAAGTETLSLATDADPDTTNGAVSIVGASVYLGNGTSADVIGRVDAIRDGEDGRPLRINFASEFANAGFETGDLSGWTAMNQRVDVGSTAIAGCTPADTGTYPGNVPNQDNNVPSSLGSNATTVTTSGEPPEGLHALQLQSTSITTAAGFDVVHGPAVYSTPFDATAGDSIFFDWRAFAGVDAFHVFGYIIDESCGNQTELLDAVGSSAGGSTAWATTQTVIPATGTYRFVFVAGTYDFSGGQAAGARLLIDNVRVIGSVVDDAIAQAVGRRLRYANASDAPPSSQTVTVTAVNVDGESGSDQITVDITGVDDEPTLDAIPESTLTNTDDGTEDFGNQSGTLHAADPDDDPISYDVIGGQAVNEDIGGTTFTRAAQGAYGTLYVDGDTGAFVYVPDDDAINARSSAPDVDEFALTATAGGVTRQRTYRVEIDVDETVPGPPRDLTARARSRRVELSWTGPFWLGGSGVTGYRVEISDDGGGTWAEVAADTGSTATTYAVTGLDNGIDYQFRVFAINATGTGTASGGATAMPRRSDGGTSPTPTPTPDPGTPGGGGQPSDEVSEDVPGGGTVTTDPGGGGPTADLPVTAAVRTPFAGVVSINVVQPRSSDNLHGLSAFGQVVEIQAPRASRREPLQVTLRVHTSELPGTDDGRVLVVKDGEPVMAPCRDDSLANPDPCIVVRSVQGGGDLLVELLTSIGGRFALTEPTRACPRSLTVSGRFDDVRGTHAGAVDCLTWWRPSMGFRDDTYRDEAAMTRGQLASIVVSTLEAGGVALPQAGATPFADLRGSVHAEAVAKLHTLGLLNGVDRDTFAPNGRLTRAQTAAILVRITEHLEGSSLSAGERGRFSDIGRSVHRTAIRKAVTAGFTLGHRNGTFRPSATVTRGQGATFVVRMLDRLVRRRHVDLPL